jgi:hypothetical protein
MKMNLIYKIQLIKNILMYYLKRIKLGIGRTHNGIIKLKNNNAK